MNLSISNITFKSIVIKNDGLMYVKDNGSNEDLRILSDAKSKFEKSNWRLIIDKDGYHLYSPKTCNTYSEPFSIKKHQKIDKDNNIKEQLIIRTGENNKTKFIIDYPTREAVKNIYKRIKSSAGLAKMLILFEILEQQHLLQKTNKKIRDSIRKVV